MQLSTETSLVPAPALPGVGVVVPEEKAQAAHWELAPEDGNFTYVRIGDVRVVYNPRQYFEPKAMAELVQSIKSQGVLQPILGRPKDGYIELIAGERRLRGALEAYGPDGQIPVFLREMTDAEAAAAARGGAGGDAEVGDASRCGVAGAIDGRRTAAAAARAARLVRRDGGGARVVVVEARC